MLLLMSSGHSPGAFCSGFCSCGDLFSETDNELSMQHAYPVHQEISDEILPMHYGRTFTREWKKRVKPAQLSSIRDLTQLNDMVNIHMSGGAGFLKHQLLHLQGMHLQSSSNLESSLLVVWL